MGIVVVDHIEMVLIERVEGQAALTAETGSGLEGSVVPALVIVLVTYTSECTNHHLALIFEDVCSLCSLCIAIGIEHGHLDVAIVGTLRHEAVEAVVLHVDYYGLLSADSHPHASGVVAEVLAIDDQLLAHAAVLRNEVGHRRCASRFFIATTIVVVATSHAEAANEAEQKSIQEFPPQFV